jgi:hypothetical protein
MQATRSLSSYRMLCLEIANLVFCAGDAPLHMHPNMWFGILFSALCFLFSPFCFPRSIHYGILQVRPSELHVAHQRQSPSRIDAIIFGLDLFTAAPPTVRSRSPVQPEWEIPGPPPNHGIPENIGATPRNSPPSPVLRTSTSGCAPPVTSFGCREVSSLRYTDPISLRHACCSLLPTINTFTVLNKSNEVPSMST